MGEFLAEILAFPTVVFTVLLGFVLLYWAIVLLGLLEIDVLDPGGTVESVDGALDAAGGDAGDAGDVDGSGLARGLQAIGLSQVPLTMSLSVLVFFGWALSYLGMRFARGLAPATWIEARLGEVALGAAIGVVAVLAAFYLTLIAIRPLRPLFVLHNAPLRRSFVGKVCTVTSSRVDGEFGQAEIEDGGAGLRVDVRCREENDLTRGSKALVYHYDAKEEVYHVSPAEKVLGG